MATKRKNVLKSHGHKIAADSVSEAGCYVCNWSGHLLRVAGQMAGSAMISIVGDEPLFLTKISDNPFIPISEANALAGSTARSTPGTKAKTAAKGTRGVRKKSKTIAKRVKKVRAGTTAKKSVQPSKTSAKRKPRRRATSRRSAK